MCSGTIYRSGIGCLRDLTGTGNEENIRLGTRPLSLFAESPNFVYSLSFQHEPTVITSKAAANGGNSLGLDISDGNICNVVLTATWDNVSDDAAVNRQTQLLFSKAAANAKELDDPRRPSTNPQRPSTDFFL